MKNQNNSIKENLKIVSLFIPEHSHSLSIPLAQSLISAGFPSSAENFVERSLDLNELLIKHPSATFFIKVLGDSMINAGIHSNDILIVDRSLTPTNNKIVVVRINDEFTVKRIQFHDDTIVLLPENSNYKPIHIKKDADFEVWGVVTNVIHNV
jgi:DNA polymerase V